MLIINKEFLQFSAQLMINSYNGKYGPIEKNMLNRVESFSMKDTNGYTGMKGGNLYIVFQGSQGIQDWLDDFEFWPAKLPFEVDGKDINIHHGFFEQYIAVRRYILDKINKSSPKEIIIIGHSLGAALASICAFDLSVTKQITSTAILFACPKIGGMNFVKAYKKYVPNTYAFIYGNDIVPRVPPYWAFYFKHYKSKWISKGISRIKYTLQNLITTLTGNPLDHYPLLYKEGISYYKETK
jgi:predicted lipase